MKQKHLLVVGLITAIGILLLTSCGNLNPLQSQPTEDVNAVMTSAASTAFVELTSMADVAATAAAMPTATVPPTEQLAPTTTVPPLEQITTTPAADVSTPLATAANGAILATATTAQSGGVPTATALISGLPAATMAGTPCNASLFQEDVTIPDKTEIKPLTSFTKIWRIKNVGTCKWTKGYGLVFFNGDRIGGQGVFFSSTDPDIEPGMEVEIPIKMFTPEKKGEYYGEWIMVDDHGVSFGYPMYVMITVKK